MTIEEAIKHEEQVASDYEGMMYDCALDPKKLAKCATEHRQLAEWLKELQERRNQPEVIRCGECVHSPHTVDGKIRYCKRHALYKLKDYFCGDAERRVDDKQESGTDG